MEDLSPRQSQVLDFITEFIQRSGFPPSLRDIAGHLGIAGNAGVLSHLVALERKGYIRREQGSSRGIRLNRGNQPEVVPVPIVGVVRAGLPQLAREEIEDHYPVERERLKGGVFFLRVRGDSMVEEGILEGDLALIRPQETADNGDIVVAMMDGEATLKRFYREMDHIRLQPGNSAMPPIIIPHGVPVTIIGKAVTIVRDIE
jgi:repressor LexA